MKKELRLFIVEDNEMFSLMLDHVLQEDMELKLSIFSSGEECLEKIHEHPDIVVLDYKLPGINGLETLLKIKKINRNIPVIIMSNQEDIGAAIETLKAGAFDYIVKGKEAFSKLINSINSIQKHKNMGDEIIVLRIKMDKAIMLFSIFLMAIAGFLMYLYFRK